MTVFMKSDKAEKVKTVISQLLERNGLKYEKFYLLSASRFLAFLGLNMQPFIIGHF